MTCLINVMLRILYSSWDSDTTFYLQLLLQLKKQLSVSVFIFCFHLLEYSSTNIQMSRNILKYETIANTF